VPPRILCYSRTVGFRHDSIADGVRALSTLAETEGWKVEATEDPASFQASRLGEFDLVLFLNTNGPVLDERGREAFAEFVRSGKGFVGVHGAAATEPDWTFYQGLVGASFKAHPHVQSALVRVEDGTHPATLGLPGAWRCTDEWYGFHTNPRPGVRVLLTLDESSYEPGDGAMGSDHPIAWCHEYEGGRAFYTALGHTPETYRDALYLGHLSGGVAWALGKR
jgi:type 1 glutamine amidotransferase